MKSAETTQHLLSDQGNDKTVAGIASMLLSVILFSLMDALVKWLSADYPTQQIVFFRCATAMVPVLLFLRQAGGFYLLYTTRPWVHFQRCFVGISAMAFAFYGFSVMRLADAVSIFYAAPLFITALSVPMLGERVGVRRWSAVIVGFIGVLIVVRPGLSVFGSGSMFMLAAAFLVAMTTNIVRKLSVTDNPASITFYFTLTGTVLGSVACLLLGWIVPPWVDVLLLMTVGILGGCAQYAMTVSIRYAEVAITAPLKYLSIVSGGILGYIIWSEIPDTQSLIGILIIMISGIYTMHRESRRSRKLFQ